MVAAKHNFAPGERRNSGREWQRYRKRGAHARLGGTTDLSPVRIDDPLADVQAQARPGLLVLFAGRVVRIEDVRQVVGRDAGARVRDLDLRAVAARAARHGDGVAGLAELDRVAD